MKNLGSLLTAVLALANWGFAIPQAEHNELPKVERRQAVPTDVPAAVSLLKSYLAEASSFCSRYITYHPLTTSTKTSVSTSIIKTTTTLQDRVVTSTATAKPVKTTRTRTIVVTSTSLGASIVSVTGTFTVTQTIPKTLAVVTIPYTSPVRKAKRATLVKRASPLDTALSVLQKNAPKLLSTACVSFLPTPRTTTTTVTSTSTSKSTITSHKTAKTTTTYTPTQTFTTQETSISYITSYFTTDTVTSPTFIFTTTRPRITATVFDICATPPPSSSILPAGQDFLFPVDEGDTYVSEEHQSRATCCTLCYADARGCNGYDIFNAEGLCNYFVGNPTNNADDNEYPGDKGPTPQCPAGKPVALTFVVGDNDGNRRAYLGPCVGAVMPL
ncbi:hypothetical protein EJ04DRAFT_527862 [Polyplosphaeria fusca]|uniref:Apple domain-containing protein n=1 Tax=Polyplosphaeria fusca TaxID=682080 RepID=A0A9P4UYN3_9PLEO|nr:hypothetical protein EJ04DRAFT_527862 [Polyplosphaeria fusca]